MAHPVLDSGSGFISLVRVYLSSLERVPRKVSLIYLLAWMTNSVGSLGRVPQ